MKSIAIAELGYIPVACLLAWHLSAPAQGKTLPPPDSPAPSTLHEMNRPARSASAASKQAETTTPAITVIYTPAETERGQEIQGLMERTQSYEQLTAGLNQVLSLPEPLTLNQAECGMVNAFYAPADRQIVMCYELVDYFLSLYAAEADIDRKSVV